MRVLLAGDWHSDIHEESARRALQTLGHDVVAFPWHQYFERLSALARLTARAQNKYLFGPSTRRLNQDLARMAREAQPDLLFIYRGSHIYPQTLEQIRHESPDTFIVGYNNDDPFSPAYPKWVWRHFHASIPAYDILFAYRQRNLDDFARAGARSAQLLMPWFTSALHHPMRLSLSEHAQFGSDVCFVGHYEADERVDYLRQLARAGIQLKIWGPSEGWVKALRRIPELKSQLPVVPVRGADYVRALCGSKIALAFFSKLNRDVYTRRSFEIPATGTFMLSERSPQVEALFREKEEAAYFHSPETLVSTAQYYLEHPSERARIALRGFERAHRDGHESIERMRQMLKSVGDLRG